MSVDFPAPLCPAKEIRSFSNTVNERSLKMTLAPNSTLSFLIASTPVV